MFGLWLRGKKETTGLEGRFVVFCGCVNKLVPVMCIACAQVFLTGCGKECSA